MITIELTGLASTLKRVKGLSGTELRRKATLAVGRTVEERVVPAVKAEERFKGHGKTPGQMKKATTARKLRTRPGEVVAFSVKARTFYAPMVIGGTKPHPIRPKNARALSFTIGGRRIVVASVAHPGAQRNPFIARAARHVSARALAARVGKELLKK